MIGDRGRSDRQKWNRKYRNKGPESFGSEPAEWQQSELNFTGELFYGVRDADFDNDGIPFAAQGPGRHGIAPSLAARVAVALDGGTWDPGGCLISLVLLMSRRLLIKQIVEMLFENLDSEESGSRRGSLPSWPWP